MVAPRGENFNRMGRYRIFTVRGTPPPDVQVGDSSMQRRNQSPKKPGLRVSLQSHYGMDTEEKMLGHSRKRDGLSPISTVHRDGLGIAPGPPLRWGLSFLA